MSKAGSKAPKGAGVDYRGIFNRACRGAGLNPRPVDRSWYVTGMMMHCIPQGQAVEAAENWCSFWLSVKGEPTPYPWHDSAPSADAMIEEAYSITGMPIVTIRQPTPAQIAAMLAEDGWEDWSADA